MVIMYQLCCIFFICWHLILLSSVGNLSLLNSEWLMWTYSSSSGNKASRQKEKNLCKICLCNDPTCCQAVFGWNLSDSLDVMQVNSLRMLLLHHVEISSMIDWVPCSTFRVVLQVRMNPCTQASEDLYITHPLLPKKKSWIKFTEV